MLNRSFVILEESPVVPRNRITRWSSGSFSLTRMAARATSAVLPQPDFPWMINGLITVSGSAEISRYSSISFNSSCRPKKTLLFCWHVSTCWHISLTKLSSISCSFLQKSQIYHQSMQNKDIGNNLNPFHCSQSKVNEPCSKEREWLNFESAD